MLSLKLRRALAGLGILSIGGLGLLAPTTAIADDDPVTVNPDDVKIGKTLISNEEIDRWRAAQIFETRYKDDFVVKRSACSEEGCVSSELIPTIEDVEISYETINEKHLSGSFLPSPDTYDVPGVYAWKVTERQVDDAFSKAEYYVRAAVRNSDSGFEYSWVTITKTKNDDGTDANGDDNPNNGPKVDSLDFVNVDESMGVYEVTKEVVNNSGLPELATYEMQVTFKWPDNFNGKKNATTGKWTDTVPDIKAADDTEATDTQCIADRAKETTTCTFSLGKDKKALFIDIPVGATYTLTETSTGNFESSITNGEGVIPFVRYFAGEVGPCFGAPSEAPTVDWHLGEHAYYKCLYDGELTLMTLTEPASTVVNTYKNVPPTGLVLEYLPYALMVIIPLAGIGAYVAMRRKLLS